MKFDCIHNIFEFKWTTTLDQRKTEATLKNCPIMKRSRVFNSMLSFRKGIILNWVFREHSSNNQWMYLYFVVRKSKSALMFPHICRCYSDDSPVTYICMIIGMAWWVGWHGTRVGRWMRLETRTARSWS